jgi:cell division initiation protein
MAITPLDIQQQRFRTRFGGGLDKVEVDGFLNAVAAEVERLIRENNELREEQRSLKRLLDDYRAREEALKETMITAQRVTEEIKKAAEKEADIIIGRAELEAERIQEQAVQRRSELLADIAELKRQRAQFLGQLRGVLNTHQKLLDVAEEDVSGPRVEENLAVMRKRPAAAPPPAEDTTRARGGG